MIKLQSMCQQWNILQALPHDHAPFLLRQQLHLPYIDEWLLWLLQYLGEVQDYLRAPINIHTIHQP